MITIDFEKKGKFGLSEFIYISIKEQILSGKLNANYKLPSKRTFAEHLGVSIITIQNAYNQLICEGYIYSLEKKGYFVTDISLEPSIKQNHKKDVINHSETKKQNVELSKKEELLIDFTNNSTSAQKFPFNLWAHILRQVLNSSDEKLLQRIDAKGIFELRKAISSYLLEFRNMDVSPEQLIIASGTETLYTILSQLLDEQTIFAVENPGYHKVEKIFRINHKNCYPIQIDEQGIIIQELEKSKAEVEVANVKKALEGTDVEAIKSASEKLTQVFYEISQKLYAEAQAAAGEQAGANAEGTDNVVHDADYKVEDDTKE